MTRLVGFLVPMVLGLMTILRVAVADLSSHCRGHHETAHHSALTHHQPASSSEPDCPHCPASSCALVAPCTSSPAPVTLEGFAQLRLDPARQQLSGVIKQFASRSPQPAFPPPRV